MAVKTIHAVVSGRVQGVYFRAYTLEEAQKYGLSGWVRNLPDGSVETIISGDAAQVDRMVSWLYMGSPMSEVRQVTIDELESDQQYSGFQIRY